MPRFFQSSSLGGIGGNVGTLITGPIQARIAALQANPSASISQRLQAALAASPIGARLQNLGAGTSQSGSGTSTQSRLIRHASQVNPYPGPSRTSSPTQVNKSILSYL